MPNPPMPHFYADGFLTRVTDHVVMQGFTHPARTLPTREVIDARQSWKAKGNLPPGHSTTRSAEMAGWAWKAGHWENPYPREAGHCPKCGGFLQYFKNRYECRDCGHRVS